LTPTRKVLRVAYFSDCLPPLTDGVARTLSHLAQTLHTERVDFRFLASVVPAEDLPWRDRVHVVSPSPLPTEMARMGAGARRTAAKHHWGVVNRGLLESYARIVGRMPEQVALTA